jgi:membrane fusion protein, heavy metal efflux system
MKPRRHLLITSLLFVVLGAAGCGHGSDAASADPDARPADTPEGTVIVGPDMLASIKVEPIAEREIGSVLTIAGKVQFDEDRLARVLVPLAGHLVDLRVKLGDPVRKGDMLCAINSRDAAAAVGEYIEARKDVELAEKTVGMTEDLFQHEAASRIALQQAQSDLAKAHSRVARTEEGLRALGLNPGDDLTHFNGRVPIVAPISGIVIDRKVTEGQFVQTDTTPVIAIADLSTVWVMGDVFERDLRFVSVGQTAAIATSAYPGEMFSGHVDYISDAIDPPTRTAKVRVSVGNPTRRLKPEMFATVTLDVAAHARAIVVPADAVFTEESQTFVYVETGAAKFVRRPVTVAQAEGTERHVLSGLQSSDRVVVDGALLLRQQERKRAS